MYEITQEYVRYLFSYMDGELYWNVRPSRATKPGDRAGSKNSRGYIKVAIASRHYSIHRLVWIYHNDTNPEFIDHINGVKSDNRIENLRPATKQQNQFNRKISKSNKSGVKGVYFYKSTGKWKAQAKLNKKVISLGYFNDIQDAAKAYDDFAKTNHGEFYFGTLNVE